MTKNPDFKHQYDLEERTFEFAKNCRDFSKKIPKTTSNKEYVRQLIRSSGSQAANYIEANEALSKKDFFHRIKISRKEVKETCLWLRLLEVTGDELEKERETLMKEGTELKKIFSAIVGKQQSL